MGREKAIASETRKTEKGSGGLFDYVNRSALERLGILEFLMPQPGDYFIRIISPKFSKYSPDDLPFYGREIFKHNEIGADGRTFICRKKMWNEPCPICELADRLRAVNPDDERAKALRWQRRYLFFVYDVRNVEAEAKGLHWFDCPVTIKDDTVSNSRDKRTGKSIDVSERTEGKDIEFTRTGTGKNTRYTGTKLVDNEVPPENWYTNAPDDFEEFLLHPTYEEVAQEVSGLVQNAPAQQSVTTNVVQDPPIAATRTRSEVVAASVPEASAPPQAALTSVVAAAPVAGQQVATPSTRGTSVRTRGNAAGGAIDPQVRARIDALKGGNKG